MKLQDDENIEWIGFDTAHYGDGKDIEKAKEYFDKDIIPYLCDCMYPIITLEDCEEECKQIVDQVIDMLGEEKMCEHSDHMLNEVKRKETKEMNMNNDILKAIEEKQKEIDDLHKELERLEKYKQYDETADQIKCMHTSFMNAGFSDEQAFALTQGIINNVCKNPNFVKVI